MPGHSSYAGGRRGFTLLELLIVMAIMVLLSTIMVTNYFGAQRAAAYSASVTEVRNALTLARQRACMDGRKTFFVFTNDTDFFVVQPIGAFTHVQGKVYYDGYVDMQESEAANTRTRIFNLENFEDYYATVGTHTMESDAGDLFKGQYVTKFEFYKGNDEIDGSGTSTSSAASVNPGWSKGDRYGVAISTMFRLPKGFSATKFTGFDSHGDNHFISFNADGSTSGGTLEVAEAINKNKPIKVDISRAGKIEVRL